MFDLNVLFQEVYTSRDPFYDPFAPYQGDQWENLFRFKSELFSLLNENIEKKDSWGIESTLAIMFWDGVDKDYLDILLSLLDQKWHYAQENIVSALEDIKDPRSIDKLYETAIHIPDDDEMRSLAIKCIQALWAINTPEAIEKLKLLQQSSDSILHENAKIYLEDLTSTK